MPVDFLSIVGKTYKPVIVTLLAIGTLVLAAWQGGARADSHIDDRATQVWSARVESLERESKAHHESIEELQEQTREIHDAMIEMKGDLKYLRRDVESRKK